MINSVHSLVHGEFWVDLDNLWSIYVHPPLWSGPVAERKDPPLNKCPPYDTKQSDGEVLEMWSTPSLPLLLDPLWLGVIAPDRVLFMGQIGLFNI